MHIIIMYKETNERIFMLVDIMLKRCENDEENFIIELTKSDINDSIVESYIMNVISVKGDNMFAEYKALLISFYFGEGEILPYITLQYSDDYRNIVKVYTTEITNKYKERVGKIYNKSKGLQFDTLLHRCTNDFDITKQEIRDNKIEKIIEEL